MSINLDKLNFERCEDEAIHVPESIQGYGYLFGLNEDNFTIEIISDNVKNLINKDTLIGTSFKNLLDESTVDLTFLKETYERAKERVTRLPLQLKFDKLYLKNDKEVDFYVVLYNSGNKCIIELEPAGLFRVTYTAKHYMKLYGMSIAPKFQEYTSLNQLAEKIVETIKDISGMDRVLLYRFNEDNSGTVIAESKKDHMDSYLNVNYPAKDIPAQARELYKKNWVRIVPNVDLENCTLLPDVKESGRERLDMTQSILRSMSPIHIQYIKNQGLKASMSMSLITHGELWGIVSCHNEKPKYVPQNVRLECENLSQLFSWHLYAKEEEFYIQKQINTDKTINALLQNVEKQSIIQIFKKNEEKVLSLLNADGFIFYTRDESITLGITPEKGSIIELMKTLKFDTKQNFSTDELTRYVEKDKLNGITGMLLITLLEQYNYFTAWFRKEHVEIQKWIGSPDEEDYKSDKKKRLSPRSSFQVNEVKIQGKSRDWEQRDFDIAERFNKVFMSYSLSTHENMRQNISELKIQDKYKDDFLATLAHELRNPLSPITTGIALLKNRLDENEKTDTLTMMSRQVNHMTRMIDDLMEVSRVTRGKVKLEKEILSVQNIVKSAIQTGQNFIDLKNHQVNFHKSDKQFYVLGDRTRLLQIFVNLINNATKYTPNNGRIDISISQIESQVQIEIQDNGQGISSEHLESIFDMFVQMESSGQHSNSGLGIGLTLVQKLILLHKGSIKAESEGLGKGSKFIVRLPLDNGDELVEQSKIDSQSSESKSKKTLLLVDDNLDLLFSYKMLLSKEGFEIIMASTGKDCINKFNHFKPDIALLDIGLPDMSGYDLSKELKNIEGSQNTIFFSQSGWGNKEHVIKSKEYGFKKHFVKPVDMNQLIAAISENFDK